MAAKYQGAAILYEWNGMPSGLEDEISTLEVALNPDVMDRRA